MVVGGASVSAIILQAFFPPFLIVLLVILTLASFGKSLGIRRLYVKALLSIFEFARKVAVEQKKRKRSSDHTFSVGESSDSDDDGDYGGEEEEEESPEGADGGIRLPPLQTNPDQDGLDSLLPDDSASSLAEVPKEKQDEQEVLYRRKKMRKFGKESRHNVISRRDNLILSPEQPPTLQEELEENGGHDATDHGSQKCLLSGKKVSVSTFQREFELDAVLDYVKTGIASIIEDEVTQRFDSEELKTWNLLTRTSQRFEYVNVKLTVMWIIGFFFRYWILLPGRICILVVGLTYLMLVTSLIPLMPWAPMRRWTYSWSALTFFRIFSRSISAVIKYHNVQYRPKSDGICVANHTTPIDVVILSSDGTYALLLWMTVCMTFVGALPKGTWKSWLHYHVYTSCFQILGGAISAVITYHNAENKPKRGICVANHTSPIDVLILACDNAYALIGQRHGGLLGQFQSCLSRSSSHIWFERSEAKDRACITKRLREHVEDPTKLPILIFPEGTCINNTSVMQFKKGSFEVGGIIYPVAIKYDPKFGDAFWNSSKYGMLSYLYMMMTSWAIVCDVWYLPPMTKGADESAVDFANRVKAEIAKQGGLVDLVWDGNLKRNQVKSEWKAQQQQEFSRRLKLE